MNDSPRVNVSTQHAETYRALAALNTSAAEAARSAGLSERLVELVRLRTSQINGCAFCLRAHSRAAMQAGATSDELAVLSAWRETGYFDDVERAALALAETVTEIAMTQVDDTTYDDAASVLDADQLSAVTWVCSVMNVFNRVAVTSRYDVH